MAEKPLAWMGGTFDPVHNGHLRIATEAAEAIAAERLSLLPCGSPPHGKQPLATSKQRLEMLRLAVAESDLLAVDSRELETSETSYTWRTLSALRQQYGSRPLCWVLGADSFLSLPSWHRWQELLDLAHFVVCQRPDAWWQWPMALPQELDTEVKSRQTDSIADLAAQAAGKVCFLELSQLDISATDIRQRERDGASNDFLAPQAVLQYIQRHGLYQSAAQ